MTPVIATLVRRVVRQSTECPQVTRQEVPIDSLAFCQDKENGTYHKEIEWVGFSGMQLLLNRAAPGDEASSTSLHGSFVDGGFVSPALFFFRRTTLASLYWGSSISSPLLSPDKSLPSLAVLSVRFFCGIDKTKSTADSSVASKNSSSSPSETAW